MEMFDGDVAFNGILRVGIPVVVENWSVLDASNAGTYADTNGSSVTFSTVKGKRKRKGFESAEPFDQRRVLRPMARLERGSGSSGVARVFCECDKRVMCKSL